MADNFESELNEQLMKLNAEAVKLSKQLSEYQDNHKKIMESIDNKRFAIRRRLDEYRRGV